jgi:hypothetical protein
MAQPGVAQMEKTRAVPIDQSMALRVADLSSESSLPIDDALVLAAARVLGAELIKSDTDFNENSFPSPGNVFSVAHSCHQCTSRLRAAVGTERAHVRFCARKTKDLNPRS